MKYSFYFRDPDAERSLLMMALRQGDKRCTLSTELSDYPKFWDKKSQTVIGSPTASLTNFSLAKWKDAADFVNSRPEYQDMKLAELRTVILERIGKVDKKAESNQLLPFYQKWSVTTTTKRKASRQMVYDYKKLKEFIGDKPFSFDDATVAWSESYIEWLAAHGISENTRGTHIKNLKTVMAEAYDQGLHENLDYKKFRKERAEVDAVYLTSAELEKLEKVKVCGLKEMARDLFIIGCYTAMRYSDYSRLSILDIEGGFIRQIQAKTKERVIIPCHPKVAKIVEKWHGAPKVSLPELNRLIKLVCREAGIDSKVTVLRGRTQERHEKWELISSHTARRTAATNMYKAGIPSISIMKITGHRTEASFLQYIRLTKEEVAASLAEHPFFKG